MIKPNLLQPGDTIAIVSLSSGILGDTQFIHKYYIAKERLEKEFGLKVKTMPNALKGSDFIYHHPEARAKDLMDAFKDTTIDAIFCAIGGDDSIRLLPYIDYQVIKNNPKIFMGYSDTTVSHFMMHKAGLVSFYGASVIAEFGEYVKMFDYTKKAVQKLLFEDCTNYEIASSPYWSNDFVNWSEENMLIEKKLLKEQYGYQVLQGKGIIKGQLLGGCIDVFPMCIGTDIWPTLEEWENKILLVETSEEKPTPSLLLYYLRNLGAQGIFKKINAIIVGKPQDETYYQEYKEIYRKVLNEFNCDDVAVLYNVNIGHASPTGVLPLGSDIQIDLDNKKIVLLESPTKKS